MENPFEIILKKLQSIEISIEELKSNYIKNKNSTNVIFDVKEVAEYIKLRVPTIYGLVV